MFAGKHGRIDMDSLGAELTRLGCGFRECGIHGFIFAPRNSGGLKIEEDALHFWDAGINVYLDLESAHKTLTALPDNAGQETLCGRLLEIASD